MRESIGATWIFSICLTFIILFTAYLAISVNYAKAFRIKSHVISMIEEHEGYNGTIESGIQNYLVAQGYSASGSCAETLPNQNGGTTDWERVACIDARSNGNCGACVYRMPVETGNDDIEAARAYYKVVTFFKFDLPVVNVLLTFPISGESRYIYDFSNGTTR